MIFTNFPSRGRPPIGLIHFCASATVQWQKAPGGSCDDRARATQQTTDGGYIPSGYSKSNNGNVTGHPGNLIYAICGWLHCRRMEVCSGKKVMAARMKTRLLMLNKRQMAVMQ